MNILLSDVCNRKCSFCFAQDVHEHKGQKFIKKEDFFTAVDFVRRSGQNEICIIGGEPSLHPQFIEILEELSQLPVGIMLFTNGVMSKEKVDYLKDVLSEKRPLKILCNVSKSDSDSLDSIEKRNYFLSRCSHLVCLSLTINTPFFEYQYAFDFIEKYHLKKRLRIGVAHPIYKIKNKFLELRYVKTIGVVYNILLKEAADRGCSVHVDCGMIPCMIKDAPSLCDCIIDIGVDLSVWACFPLSTFERAHLSQFKNGHEAKLYFADKVKEKGCSKLFDHCETCNYKSTCNGGCLAHRLNL